MGKDTDFLREVVRIIGHVVQEMESRLKGKGRELQEMVFTDLVQVLEDHFRNYEAAFGEGREGKIGARFASYNSNLMAEEIFHSLCPHEAISVSVPSSPSSSNRPQASIDKDYVRTVVTLILEKLLPPEDYSVTAERVMVRDILVNMVVGKLVDKLSQPWFIHQIIIKILGGDSSLPLQPEATDMTPEFEKMEEVTQKEEPPFRDGPASLSPVKPANQSSSRLKRFFIKLPSRLVTSINFLFSPSFSTAVSLSFSKLASLLNYLLSPASPEPTTFPPPLLMPSLNLMSSILEPAKLPHLQPILVYSQLFAYITSSVSDPFISDYFLKSIISQELLIKILESATESLFPGGWPGPAPPEPNGEEEIELKRRAEIRLADRFPGS
jgi:hypothetical protein